MRGLQASSLVSKIDDRIVQSDLEFRPTAKVVETLTFVRSDGVRLYIDVDEDDIPVAMELVHPEDQKVEYTTIDENDREAVERTVMRAFSFASKMVSWQREFQETLANFALNGHMLQTGRSLLNRTTRELHIVNTGHRLTPEYA